MKLTKEQLAGELERPAVFLRHYGRLYEVTAVTTDTSEANAHMSENKGEGLLREYGAFCFIARMDDKGQDVSPYDGKRDGPWMMHLGYEVNQSDGHKGRDIGTHGLAHATVLGCNAEPPKTRDGRAAHMVTALNSYDDLTAAARRLVALLDQASPSDLAEAARALDDLSTGNAGTSHRRRIARELAPVFHKLRK
jgi:hypothetical protein